MEFREVWVGDKMGVIISIIKVFEFMRIDKFILRGRKRKKRV